MERLDYTTDPAGEIDVTRDAPSNPRSLTRGAVSLSD